MTPASIELAVLSPSAKPPSRCAPTLRALVCRAVAPIYDDTAPTVLDIAIAALDEVHDTLELVAQDFGEHRTPRERREWAVINRISFRTKASVELIRRLRDAKDGEA